MFEICEQGQRSERDTEDPSRLLMFKTYTIVRLIQTAISIKGGWGAGFAKLII